MCSSSHASAPPPLVTPLPLLAPLSFSVGYCCPHSCACHHTIASYCNPLILWLVVAPMPLILMPSLIPHLLPRPYHSLVSCCLSLRHLPPLGSNGSIFVLFLSFLFSFGCCFLSTFCCNACPLLVAIAEQPSSLCPSPPSRRGAIITAHHHRTATILFHHQLPVIVLLLLLPAATSLCCSHQWLVVASLAYSVIATLFCCLLPAIV
jgi:hypothetical protein